MISFCCTFFSNDSPSLRRAHCHGEHRAVCLVGAHRYLAVHEFGEVFDYGKSRSVAAVLAARLVRAVEPLKDVSYVLLGYRCPFACYFRAGFTFVAGSTTPSITPCYSSNFCMLSRIKTKT